MYVDLPPTFMGAYTSRPHHKKRRGRKFKPTTVSKLRWFPPSNNIKSLIVSCWQGQLFAQVFFIISNLVRYLYDSRKYKELLVIEDVND